MNIQPASSGITASVHPTWTHTMSLKLEKSWHIRHFTYTFLFKQSKNEQAKSVLHSYYKNVEANNKKEVMRCYKLVSHCVLKSPVLQRVLFTVWQMRDLRWRYENCMFTLVWLIQLYKPCFPSFVHIYLEKLDYKEVLWVLGYLLPLQQCNAKLVSALKK